MKNLEECQEQLLEAIRESSQYRMFAQCKDRLEGMPEKKEKIDAFRRRVFLLQNESDAFDRPGEMSGLFREREELIRDPLIADYLASELSLCRLLQRICLDVMGIADLQIEPFEDCIKV